MKISHEQLIESIMSTRGNVSAIARKFLMTRQGVAKRINEQPDLRRLLEEQTESLIDLAECQLAKAVRRGSPWAVKFVLSTKGRNRGYGRETKVQVEQQPRGQVVLLLPDDGRNAGMQLPQDVERNRIFA